VVRLLVSTRNMVIQLLWLTSALMLPTPVSCTMDVRVAASPRRLDTALANGLVASILPKVFSES
jgi:hypothetical protein